MHNGAGTAPALNTTSPDDQAVKSCGCARAQPWLYGNDILRRLPWQEGDESSDSQVTDNDDAADSHMAEIDITTPEIADTTSKLTLSTEKSQRSANLELTETMPAACTTNPGLTSSDAVNAGPSTTHAKQSSQVHKT